MEAWEKKQIRDAQHRAQLELTIAISSGMKKKGGGRLTVDDFLPDFAKPKKKETTPEESEKKLKAARMAMAKQHKTNG